MRRQGYQRALHKPVGGYMQLHHHIAQVEALLEPWRQTLGCDYQAYRNHIYRLLHYAFYLALPEEDARQKLVIAAVFHDLGIWSEETLDYIPPSVELARHYLREQGQWHWGNEVALMIEMHHKLTAYRGPHAPLVELFRLCDRIDLSWGLIRSGVSASYIARVKQAFPNAGFHRRLCYFGWVYFKRHPFNPLPMFRW